MVTTLFNGSDNVKIVSVVGKKNTGKTSLTIKIIEALINRGYKVATIKHSHHTMEMDKENTDTWRHKQAGSELVVGIGSSTFFNIKDTLELERILFLIKAIGNYDFVVIEGFKAYSYPKIATCPDVVDEYTIREVDSFSITPEEIEDLCDLIEKRAHDITDTLYLNNCGLSNGLSISKEIVNGKISTDELDKVNSTLSVNGKVIGLNRFVSDFIEKTMVGLLSALNYDDYGINYINDIELLINHNYIEGEKMVNNYGIDVKVNEVEIETNEFVSNYLKDTLFGMISALHTKEYGVDDIESAEINILKVDPEHMSHAEIALNVNGKAIGINEFVSGIMKESIYGMIKALNTKKFGVDEIKDIDIKIKK